MVVFSFEVCKQSEGNTKILSLGGGEVNIAVFQKGGQSNFSIKIFEFKKEMFKK